MAVDLIVPLKPPAIGKSRLRAALGSPVQDRHAELVLALAFDTLRAAASARGVRRVLVVGPDPMALDALRELDVEVVGENGVPGLNNALRTGEDLLRADDGDAAIAVLQADLPALRAEELAAALSEADDDRMYVADRHGTGTTLLVAGPGRPLDPRFGPDSARAHAESGAQPVRLPVPSLRSDVDTPEDLEHIRRLGLGAHTGALLDSMERWFPAHRAPARPIQFQPAK